MCFFSQREAAWRIDENQRWQPLNEWDVVLKSLSLVKGIFTLLFTSWGELHQHPVTWLFRWAETGQDGLVARLIDVKGISSVSRQRGGSRRQTEDRKKVRLLNCEQGLRENSFTICASLSQFDCFDCITLFAFSVSLHLRSLDPTLIWFWTFFFPPVCSRLSCSFFCQCF